MGARAERAKAHATSVFETMKKWHWLLTVGLGLMLIMGFGVETPGKRIERIETRVNNTNSRVDSMQTYQTLLLREIRKTQRSLDGLLIGECLDRPKRETQLQRLPCDELLHPRRRPVSEESDATNPLMGTQ